MRKCIHCNTQMVENLEIKTNDGIGVYIGEKLLKLVKARNSRPKKDNARITSQIRSIIEKWKY